MKFHTESAELFVPDGVEPEVALKRTTVLAISAHQDDLEIMAYHGILRCFANPNEWFTGVVVTNGSGSARDNLYANYTDEQMVQVRRQEQKKAATIGEYSSVALLDYPSSAVKDPAGIEPAEDLKRIIESTRPDVIYAHNLADKHDTHVAVTLRTIETLRKLPPECRPQRLLGCEVWRDLDWLCDDDKQALPVDAHENLANALLGVYDSQIAGGKRYDLASMGRRRAHATYHASHGTDETEGLTFAMDLTPLLDTPDRDPADYVATFVQRFADDVNDRMRKLS
ncbi:MAG: PIG-L family deacetylase [Lentisphaerae bacterium]|jgi:LmbE family N-acetylglucosaminyl deacetylase|nr:PIG-L family deacetylase [Lentisphaerota bacterium]MBT4819621.1 PIG-L family deacetylase [Lentisphaerota bacterium]MBT5607277.1 PIG-L family deacetylase [Lentisphaerota bacterium]MBT7058794.1 PIG-L family deacetylase [Lentisphaerota bacterium]MBT7842396.1 PIG-L family deacetylase [Lentisphaerota bacterium]